MKLVFGIIASLPIFFFLACESNLKNEDGVKNEVHGKTLVPNPLFKEKIVRELSTKESIDHLDSLFTAYSPDQCHQFPIDSNLTKLAFFELRANERDSLKCYVTWFMLKKYRYHLECCNQSYNLRTNANTEMIDSLENPIFFEFWHFSNSMDQNEIPTEYPLQEQNIEFISSGIAMTYLEENLYLTKFPPIAEEYDRILKIYELFKDPDFDVVQPDYYEKSK